MQKTPRVLIHNDEAEPLAEQLQARFPKIPYSCCTTYAALPGAIDGFKPDIVYSVRFDGSVGFPRDALLGPTGPKWIANGGAGTDHYGQWDTARTTITNAAGVAADMMAEYILGGFLHFTLDVPGLKRDQQQRTWAARMVRPLKGQTLLVVGLGHTGQALAKRAQAFGMHVIGTRSRPKDTPYVNEVSAALDLHTLLPRADFAAISTPLTAGTQGLIGAAELALMKKSAILADVSRGSVVDQTALHHALKTRQLAAAVLDVFEVEPLPHHSPLWALENVLLSPHCSSVYEGWSKASFELFLENLARWIADRPLLNVVDPLRGY